MSTIDFVLSIITIYFIYQGYHEGFIRFLTDNILLTIANIILAYILSIKMLHLIYPEVITSYALAFIISFVVIMILSKILLKKFGIFTLNHLKKSNLLWVNQLLGGVLGFIKVSLIMFIFLSFTAFFQITSIMKVFYKSEVAKILYTFSRKMTGINLMYELKHFSAQKSLDKTKEVIKKIENFQ